MRQTRPLWSYAAPNERSDDPRSNEAAQRQPRQPWEPRRTGAFEHGRDCMVVDELLERLGRLSGEHASPLDAPQMLVRDPSS
ncbi:MAG TPA: hypothetical protein VED43_14515, partial [Mycobacterium sp.]|nr:hypothetical protein [Mycobacterium sp.]